MKCSQPPCQNNAAICPQNRPFSYLGGDYCCSSALEKKEAEFLQDGNNCNGRMMSWKSSCCKDRTPHKCPNPPCRDAAIANQAKLDYYFENLPDEKYDAFFQEDMFLVKKGWHDINDNQLKRNKNLDRQRRQIAEENSYPSIDEEGIVNEEKAIIENKTNDRNETRSANVQMLTSAKKTSEHNQETVLPSLQNTTSTYETIALLRKILGETSKCREEKCKKYSMEIAKGNSQHFPICFNPPCSSYSNHADTQEKMNMKISFDTVEQDRSTNVIIDMPMPPTSPNLKNMLLDDKVLYFLVIGGIISILILCCGCFCVVRECLRYNSEKKEKEKRKMKRQEEFDTAQTDNYLKRELREISYNPANEDKFLTNDSTHTTCLSDNAKSATLSSRLRTSPHNVYPFEAKFEKRFKSEDTFPAPNTNDQYPRVCYENSQRILRSNTMKATSNRMKHVGGSNLDIHTLGRGRATLHPYPPHHRSHQHLQPIRQNERSKSEFHMNTLMSHRNNIGSSLNHLKAHQGTQKRRIKENRQEDVLHEENVHLQKSFEELEFTNTLRKEDRNKSQSSKILDAESEHLDLEFNEKLSDSGSKSKSLQSLRSPEETFASYHNTNFETNTYGATNNGQNEAITNVVESLSTATLPSVSMTHSVEMPNDERPFPPLPPIPTNTIGKFDSLRKFFGNTRELPSDISPK